MKSRYRIIIAILVIAVGGAAFAYYYMMNKPRRNVENEKGISITAIQLIKEFQENEAAANTKYLDKAIEVTGAVAEVSNNQDGKLTVMLASDDAFTGVFCTLKENADNIKPGSSVTIKGLCSGMLTDVRLREAVIVNN